MSEPENRISPLNLRTTPRRVVNLVWWALVWRMAIVTLISVAGTFVGIALLDSIFQVPGDAALLVSLALVIIGAYFVVRSLIGKSFSGFLLLAVPEESFQALLPGSAEQINCRLTSRSTPYQMLMEFGDNARYVAKQHNSAHHLFTVKASDGTEVAHCASASLLNDQDNTYTIERSDSPEPSINVMLTGNANEAAICIGDVIEKVNYTRATQEIPSAAAVLHFKWNQVSVIYDREKSPLSQPLLSALIFFLFLQRSQAGGG